MKVEASQAGGGAGERGRGRDVAAATAALAPFPPWMVSSVARHVVGTLEESNVEGLGVDSVEWAIHVLLAAVKLPHAVAVL